MSMNMNERTKQLYELFQKKRWTIGLPEDTVFSNENDIFHDSPLALGRDNEGILWAIPGHCHMGHVGMFSGDNIFNMKEKYPVNYQFQWGTAGPAYNGSYYPDGMRSRGSLWPMGLYVHPETGWFYCFFHNETTSRGFIDTSYSCYGDTVNSPPFRHIGLMVSEDQGKNFRFFKWIITSDKPSCTDLYMPDGVTKCQPSGVVSLGTGDFSVFQDRRGGYIYLTFTEHFFNMDTQEIDVTKAYIARSKIDEDGSFGPFYKLHDGKFNTPGNKGAATPIVTDAIEPYIVYYEPENCYLMFSARGTDFEAGKPCLQISVSDDMYHWSPTILLAPDRDDLVLPYNSVSNNDTSGPYNYIGNEFSLLSCHNGTDMKRFAVKIED